MAKQVQLRRGTTTQHQNFTGAVGEVTVDTTAKTLRVHDGETPGGTMLAKQSDIPAPVIAAIQKQQNGYVKFANGLIIQWGKVDPTETSTLIRFPIAFTTTDPALVFGSNEDMNQWALQLGSVSFKLNVTKTNRSIRWIAVGY